LILVRCSTPSSCHLSQSSFTPKVPLAMHYHISFATSCVLSLLLLFQLVGCSTSETPNGSAMTTIKESSSKPELKILELGEKARKNLRLVVKAVRPTDYWRTIAIPGVVAERPGVSDRGVTSPAVGVVSEIHVFPGDTVKSGQRLVTLRLFSEYLQATQTQLFRASQEAKIVQQQIDRLADIANAGAVSGSRLIELRNDLQRQQTLIRAAKQELLNRGLTPEHIASVTEGTFVSTIDVAAPPPRNDDTFIEGLVQLDLQNAEHKNGDEIAYEVHSLGVELGQTVQAGDLLASLANHQSLFVIGHAFKREAGLLEQAAQRKTPLEIEFAEDSSELWPTIDQPFQIRHLSNTLDTATRTLDFFVPLNNQSRAYEKEGKTFLVWRFRPGQRTRIEIPVEKIADVYVLPADAVVREGADVYVYRQNGDLFNQIAVQILHEDRTHVVLANDRSITPGTFLAQNSAASLRRVLKAQSASGQQPGFHVHADGTVHAAH
jgi:cobalt-zinc-cadmium efflux system membrane fusion protein